MIKDLLDMADAHKEYKFSDYIVASLALSFLLVHVEPLSIILVVVNVRLQLFNERLLSADIELINKECIWV
jgi:hypothetical protein